MKMKILSEKRVSGRFRPQLVLIVEYKEVPN